MSVRIGIIGTGIGRYHLQSYKQCPDADVVAVCDVDEERARQLADDFGVPSVCTDYRELVNRGDVDAVSVCTPNFLHAPITMAAFEAGKHVLCEKPLALNPQEGEAMIEASKKAGKVFMVAFNNRFRGDTQTLKKFIANGELGEIYYAKTGWIRRKGIPGMGGWFTTKERSGGGPLIDIGVHVLDLTLWLMGNPKAVSVTGATYAMFGPKGEGMGAWAKASSNGTFDVEDLAAAFVRLENGATLILEASWASHIKEDLIYTTLVGTAGGADVKPFRVYKDMHGVPVDITPAYTEQDQYAAEVRHFVECIQTGAQPISPGEHGLEITRILDAIYRSAEEKREIVLG